jgi:hypothetical protein
MIYRQARNWRSWSQLETLRRDIRRLQLEQDLLKKANEILKKDLGIDQQLLTNREKTLLVDALRQTYTLVELLDESGPGTQFLLLPSSPARCCGQVRRGASNPHRHLRAQPPLLWISADVQRIDSDHWSRRGIVPPGSGLPAIV